MTSEKKDYFQQYVRQAKNAWHFTVMVRTLRETQSKPEMERVAIPLFITDMNYDRSDICLALKCVEFEKGWR